MQTDNPPTDLVGKQTMMPAVLFVWLAATQIPPAAAENDKELRAYFLSEYPRALQSLEAAYSNASAAGKSIFSRRPTENRSAQTEKKEQWQVIGVGKLRLMRKGDFRLVERELRDPASKDGRRQLLQASGAKYSFTLEGKPSLREGSPVVKGIGKPTTRSDHNAAYDLYLQPVFDAPYDLPVARMSELVKDVNAIKGVSKIEFDGKPCLKVQFDARAASKSPKYQFDGWFVVSPQDGWALVSYDITLRDPKKGLVREHCFEGVHEYDVRASGPPLLRRVVLLLYDSKREFVLDELELGTVSEKQFTLSAYGLPEFDQPFRRARPGMWYLGFGVLACLIAIGLGYLSRRARRAA